MKYSTHVVITDGDGSAIEEYDGNDIHVDNDDAAVRRLDEVVAEDTSVPGMDLNAGKRYRIELLDGGRKVAERSGVVP